MADVDEATTEPQNETTELAWQINDLWTDEGCDWKIRHDCGDWPWVALLEWTQEGGSPHHADWTTHVWQFYGDTVEDALSEAVKWLSALADIGEDSSA